MGSRNGKTDKVKEEVKEEIPTHHVCGTRFRTYKSVSEEKLLSSYDASPETQILEVIGEVDLEDINLDITGVKESKHIAEYCLPLYVLNFCGQTSQISGDADEEKYALKNVVTLKDYLGLFDKYLRQHKKVTDFTGETDEYKLILKLIANHRYVKNEETVEECFERLLKDSKRFVEIYHKRGRESSALCTIDYWGSRQQLLAAKVIADWVDRDNGPLDPIFGVMLNPTAGRVGPGDNWIAYWMHAIFFDDRGDMAYHSAVHDAFGYLKTHHNIGPGYDYLSESLITARSPLSGQYHGIKFWRTIISEIESKNKVLNHFRS